MSELDINDCAYEEVYKKMIFSLSMFHAIIQDRRKYGSLGWNIYYDFPSEDFSICKKDLKDVLESMDSFTP